MLLSDSEIQSLCGDWNDNPMIVPFVQNQKAIDHFKGRAMHDVAPMGQKPMYIQGREVEVRRKLISFGLSSAGYDMRLSSKDIRIFGHNGTEAIDPKEFCGKPLYTPDVHKGGTGKYVLIPPKTYGLGVSMERFDIPRDVLAICVGKSTLARCGLFINTTPLEPGWAGHLTIEFFNANNAPFKLYVEEGISQCLFYRTGSVMTSYSDRGGKYQDQAEEVVLPRMKESEDKDEG